MPVRVKQFAKRSREKNIQSALSVLRKQGTEEFTTHDVEAKLPKTYSPPTKELAAMLRMNQVELGIRRTGRTKQVPLANIMLGSPRHVPTWTWRIR